jgi:L-alanine-DL-glutamate epimerase-like enolase superfamily enzyme
VVVDDLDIVRIASLPYEADAPLVVDANAVLAPAVALERLQMIAWRGLQVLEDPSAVQIEQLPASRPLDGSESTNRLVVEQFLHILVLEGPEL